MTKFKTPSWARSEGNPTRKALSLKNGIVNNLN